MKLKEECKEMKKNKGEPDGPPSFLFEPWRGARVGSHRCPVLRPGCGSVAIENHLREKTRSTFVTVLIRRFGRANPCGSTPARVSPGPGHPGQACKLIMERRGVPQDDRTDFIGVGRMLPERGRN